MAKVAVKIKPCNHCDFPMRENRRGDPLTIANCTVFSADKARGGWQVKCPNCGACGPDWLCDYMIPCQTREDAVTAWNIRIKE